MNRYLPSALALALGLAATSGVFAQTPSSSQTNPSSSSSSSTSNTQSEASPTNGADPSAASSPHQRETTGGKTSHTQMMKDCIAKEQANNANTSEAQAKKTCKQQMKSQSKGQ